ncbi:Ger(x)C family spore germination protein [Paenibacillus kribbensis]|uniref:Ger(x)C family spore germination protein n=1 Tax=Paenibacillus kribbensis TaxID=172713 RepID=UPI002DB87A90|nr:Ger(x)C family spore germination protein [Paenibacillus kribbensis]MEC0236353.1 Ger(x)C family spore germination protein [Paenibacillus kribbensis]
MRPYVYVAISMLSFSLLTGCWDKSELTEFGYVQAVAIDRTEEGKVKLTTHFYNPTGGTETGGTKMGGADKTYQRSINIQTEADTVFEAVRDIPIHLGRKAKWDHMRIILIGEQLSRKQNVSEILDYFSRDHEPRATVLTLIAAGEAGDYLNTKPFIEQTVGQQFRKIEESTARYSAKSSRVPLFELAIQLKGESEVAMVPYIYKNESTQKIFVAGIALLKKGKLTGSILSSKDTGSLLMLINKYKSGILEYPCTETTGEKKTRKESYEIYSLDTKVTTSIKENEVTIHVLTKIKGAVGELRCSSLKSIEEGRQIENKINELVKRDILKVTQLLQKERMDAIGIGNQIYRKNPSLWKRWKPSWNERFAESRFEVVVETKILNTGMDVGTPFGEKGG